MKHAAGKSVWLWDLDMDTVLLCAFLVVARFHFRSASFQKSEKYFFSMCVFIIKYNKAC